MFKSKIFVIVLVLLATLLVTTAVGAAPQKGATVSLSVDQAEFGASQDVLVTVTITNTTKHTIRVLKWFTPADGVEEALFVVKRDGQAVSYTGAIYKRPAATGRDYVSLKAGESISSVVNLGEFYDLSVSGQYEIFYHVSDFNLFSEQGNALKTRDSITSTPISFKADGRSPQAKPTPPPPTGELNNYNACTVDQQADILAAREQAKIYASEAENYLLAGTLNARYTTWFGAYTATRYNTVRTHFTALSNAWDNASVTYNCKCKQPYYAYVYPNQPYQIYLCKYFWLAPLSGTDSKAGTLIHEMSHFNVVAQTDDFVYGQTGAMDLAINNPDQAIMNADSHEYFAENTPRLP